VLQNYKMLSEPAQIIEALIKGKRFSHDGHRILRWNWENVAVKTDDAGRIRPVKPKRASKRVDGAVATIMANKAMEYLQKPKEYQVIILGGQKG
jgi:phage terminase large subunit-like protein